MFDIWYMFLLLLKVAQVQYTIASSCITIEPINRGYLELAPAKMPDPAGKTMMLFQECTNYRLTKQSIQDWISQRIGSGQWSPR